MIKAGIDIGSNSILLLIADVDGGVVTPLHEEYHFPRLGKGVAETNKLSPSRMDIAEEIVRSMIVTANKHNCARVIAAATAAIREATNGGDFTDRIRNNLDLRIQIIPGEEEAILSYLGATSSQPDPHQKLAVIDIGGGSTETVVGLGRQPENIYSSPVGAVKLFDQYGKNPGLVPTAIQLVDRHIERIANSSRDSELIAVGGTATTLAAIKLEMKEYDAEEIEGQVLTIDEVSELIDLFRELTVEEIRGLPGMEPGRADIIEAGATILHRFMHIGGHQSFRVTGRGLRYGLLLRY